MAMPYSGWRFSCDRGTLERCAGALEIKSVEIGGHIDANAEAMGVSELISTAQDQAFAAGGAAALRSILADGDGIDPAEFTAQVMARAMMRGGVVE